MELLRHYYQRNLFVVYLPTPRRPGELRAVFELLRLEVYCHFPNFSRFINWF